MKRIKIAQVGTGHDHASSTFNSLLKNSDLFEVVGLAEPNPYSGLNEGVSCPPLPKDLDDLMKEYGKKPSISEDQLKLYGRVPRYTVEELLAMDDLEAVTVETEENISTQFSQMFAEKGIAVHLDKPGSQSLEDFTRLIETAKRKNLPFQMGYMYRYNPLIRRVVDMAKDGELGEIFAVEAQMSVCHPPEKRAWLKQFKGGMLYFLGCHLIDLVMQIKGAPDEIIPMNMSTGIDCGGAEDYGFAVMKYKNGVSFVKSCATEFGGFPRRQVVVTGSRGSVEIKPTEINIGGACVHTIAHATLEKDNPPAWYDGSQEWEVKVDRYDNMMCSFARVIRGEEDMLCSYDYELELFKVILKCCGAL